MIPYLLAALAAAAIGYFIFRSKKTKSNSDNSYSDSQTESKKEQKIDILKNILNGDDVGSFDDDSVEEVREGLRVLQNFIEQIHFSNVRSFVKSVKVGEKEVETKEITDNINIRPIQSISEVSKILPNQYAFDDDLFYGKLVSNGLLSKHYITGEDIIESKIEKMKKKVVSLADFSGSMHGCIRIIYCIELLKRIAKKTSSNSAELTVFPFHSSVQESLIINNYDSRTENEINRLSRYSGGTDLSVAIAAGLEVFENSHDYQDAQLIVITDGTEGVNSQEILKKIKLLNVKLLTICIGVNHEQLRNISHKYYFIED